jgi:uncharacterized protein (TIGR00297 family)
MPIDDLHWNRNGGAASCTSTPGPDATLLLVKSFSTGAQFVEQVTLLIRAIVGVAASSVVADLGRRTRSLSTSGEAAAVLVGTAAVAAGWDWTIILLSYFAASSLLSRIGARRKQDRFAGIVEKSGARDAAQVLANGTPFVVAAILAICRPHDPPDLWLALGAAALAASAADTWATEIGTLVGAAPRSIVTWKRVPAGTSGGVSAAGWVAAISGALFVSGVAVIVGLSSEFSAFVVLGGIAGSAADSLLGASLQRRAWCDACDLGTEMRVHHCGTITRHVGGIAWVENDAVNLVANTAGALVAFGAILLATRLGGGPIVASLPLPILALRHDRQL